MEIIDWNALSAAKQTQLLARPAQQNSQQLSAQVADIIEQVKQNGDEALLALSERFDGVTLTRLDITATQITNASAQLSEEFKHAITQAKANITRFHQAQLPQSICLETQKGVLCEQHSAPIERVGLYVPGGTAPLPSTVLMLAIPASIAGCEHISLCSPPPITPEILYTAAQCGVSAIYAVGGAQAIAAMALGTQSISKVDKIFGPGNAYVTEAKQQVSQMRDGAAIDMPAGPSEVLVICDNAANPAFVAADLLSQAEHGSDSQVILVCDELTQLEKVKLELERQLDLLSRRDIASQALKHSRAFLVKDIAQGIDLSNRYGPEHLIVQTRDPRRWLKNIKHAGSVFLGEFTPESVGDYASGTNHTLPTYGYTRSYNALGTQDFMTRFSVQEVSFEGLKALRSAVVPLANAEGLDAHRRALTLRLNEEV